MNALEFQAAEQGVAPEPYMPNWFASLCTSNHGTGELERSNDGHDSGERIEPSHNSRGALNSSAAFA